MGAARNTLALCLLVGLARARKPDVVVELGANAHVPLATQFAAQSCIGLMNRDATTTVFALMVSDDNAWAEILGVTAADIDTKAMAALLCRMQLPTKIDGDVLRVEVPPTRSDILHPCDVAEDVAIAYGYNNINKEKAGPNVVTVGAQQPLNNFSDLVRQEMASQGFSEVLTWILCSHDDNFANVSREDDGNAAAIVANPSSLDVQVARSSLLQGVLKAMGANKDAPVPAKLFEVGDVVLLDESKDVGARNSRRLLVLYSNTTSGFEVVHGALDRVMQITGAAKDGDAGYTLDTSMNEATYFPGRQAGIVRDGKRIGVMGVVHPTVLGKFDIVNPCSVLELDLEPFVDIGM